jgi:hypothetical protein
MYNSTLMKKLQCQCDYRGIKLHPLLAEELHLGQLVPEVTSTHIIHDKKEMVL